MHKEEMAKDMRGWIEKMKDKIVAIAFHSCDADIINFRGQSAYCSHMVKWDLPIVMLDMSFHPMPSMELLLTELKLRWHPRLFCFLRQDATISSGGSFMFVVLPKNKRMRKRARIILDHLPVTKDDGQEAGWLYSLDFDAHRMPIRKLAELYDE